MKAFYRCKGGSFCGHSPGTCTASEEYHKTTIAKKLVIGEKSMTVSNSTPADELLELQELFDALSDALQVSIDRTLSEYQILNLAIAKVKTLKRIVLASGMSEDVLQAVLEG